MVELYIYSYKKKQYMERVQIGKKNCSLRVDNTVMRLYYSLTGLGTMSLPFKQYRQIEVENDFQGLLCDTLKVPTR